MPELDEMLVSLHVYLVSDEQLSTAAKVPAVDAPNSIRASCA